jgi:C4-dicarboxylate transporter/malic acid transport protein
MEQTLRPGLRTIGTRYVRHAEASVGPAWFTSVMGTGILGICAFVSPISFPLLRTAGVALFCLDVALFVAFTALLAERLVRRPATLAASLRDVAKAQTWGAPPMACFTVAVGFLRIGTTFLDPATCVAIAQVLWIVGAVASVASAFVVPFLMFTTHELSLENTYGSWLLPVVPPIVASVPAALLLPTWPLALQASMLAIAYAMLGIGILLAAILIVIFYGRLLYGKVPEPAFVPSMWLVLGPLGQSIAGFIALGTVASRAWPALGHGLLIAALAYSVIVWGFGTYWFAMAAAVTLRAIALHMPFTLGWWAFTFPVGTMTAGTYALYGMTNAPIFLWFGALYLASLATFWAIVATHSLRHVRASLATAPAT